MITSVITFGYLLNNSKVNMSLIKRKPVFRVPDQAQHKPGCSATEDGQRLEISDLSSRGILYYPYSENKSPDRLRSNREADLSLCFRISKKPVFSRRGSYNLLLFDTYMCKAVIFLYNQHKGNFLRFSRRSHGVFSL